jgi:hypothetical protein
MGGLLGLVISGTLGTWDSWRNNPPSQRLTRILTTAVLGFFVGFAGGMLCELTVKISPLIRFLGWTILGVGIGSTVYVYEVLHIKLAGRPPGLATRKWSYAVIGGACAGTAGGLVFSLLEVMGVRDLLPRFSLAISFALMGSLLGLSVGLSQILAKETWIRVQSGSSSGKELVLTSPETAIGRAESCDFSLSGYPGIDPVHARIHREGESFVLADAGSQGGTFLNNRRVTHPTRLYPGDLIRLGGSVLVLEERQSRVLTKMMKTDSHVVEERQPRVKRRTEDRNAIERT